MITLSLDRFDFLSAVEGFARGSHLRQHVWKDIVYMSIPQMNDDDMDFFWYFFRRNLWDCYFYKLDNKEHTHVGYQDYIHALAALHRGNRYKVKFVSEADKKQHEVLCYRFDGEYRPLYIYDENGNIETTLQSFDFYLPEESIKEVHHQGLPKNANIQYGHEHWWSDLEVYNTIVEY